MPMGITLLLVTSSPGGSYSNWWCSLFNADLALSVAMTTLSTFISIAALPANLLMYTHFAYGFDGEENTHVLSSISFPNLLISIAIVISGIMFGIYAGYKINSRKFRKVANAGGTIAGIILIIVSAVVGTTGDSEAKPWNQNWTFYVGVAMPCVGGLAVANLIARFAGLKKPEVVTLSVECCYQNTGIATTAVLAMFSDPNKVVEAMAVPLYYGLVEMVLIGGYCMVAWKLGWTKAPKEEKLCLVVSKTYEVEDSDIDDTIVLQNDSLKKQTARDRFDTVTSEDITLGVSMSDTSSDAISNNPDSSNCRTLKHSRSLPMHLQANEVKVSTFQTIREETENGVEVSTHKIRDLTVEDDNNLSVFSKVQRFLSFKGDQLDSRDEENQPETML